ncbi:MAG: hypothetical protein WA004_03510, partial [Saprospiraceae bacterium]
MIRYTPSSERTLSLFRTPFEQKLSPDNRWVRMAELVPWDEMAQVFFSYLSADQGRPTVDLDYCENGAPECTPEMKLAQQITLQSIIWELNPENLVYPAKLFRVILCDGAERYMLPGEIQQLFGNYTILQQIDVSHPDQDFVLRIGTDLLSYTDLGGYYTIVDQIMITGYLQELDVDFPDGSTHTVIFKDLGSVLFTVGMEITINDYESCFEELPCDEAPVTCEVPYQTERQNDWIQNVLIGSFFPGQSSGNIIYPSKLYRVRFCEGLELYLFHQELYAGYSLGGYKILQVIEVPGAGQNYEVKDATGTRILVGVQAFLDYRSNLIDDFAVSGYNCAPFPVENGETCPDDEIAGQQAALAQVRSSMSERTPSTIQIPQDLLR